MLVRFSAIKTWKNVRPGNFIGPAYGFKELHGMPHVVVDRGQKGEEKRSFVLQEVAANYGKGRFLNLYPEAEDGEQNPYGKNPMMRWGNEIAGAEIERIRVPKSERGSGIASVMGNIFLRSAYDEGVPFKNIFSTQTQVFSDSDLSIVGWLAKFGVDSYKKDELEKALSVMLRIDTPIGVDAVSGRDDLFYLSWKWLEKFEGHNREVEHKVFLVKGPSDMASLKQFIYDRKRIEKMIRDHEAYVSLRMHMDPEKAESMEAYASALPENPKIEGAGGDQTFLAAKNS